MEQPPLPCNQDGQLAACNAHDDTCNQDASYNQAGTIDRFWLNFPNNGASQPLHSLQTG